MNEIVLKTLRLNNYTRTNEGLTADVDFMLPSNFTTESTLSLRLTGDQARRIVAAATDAIKDACVERLESVRNDMLLVLDEVPALPAEVLVPITPSVGEEPADSPAEA